MVFTAGSVGDIEAAGWREERREKTTWSRAWVVFESRPTIDKQKVDESTGDQKKKDPIKDDDDDETGLRKKENQISSSF